VVRSVAASVGRTADGGLRLVYVIDADVGRLRVPAPAPPRPVIGLWEHTCVEAFIGRHDTPVYHELNFAPSGEWALFAFRGYRDVAPLPDDVAPPRITASGSVGRLELDVSVDASSLSLAYVESPLRLALSAVIEETDGRLSYWSLRHPPGKPDFHHPDAFALMLEAPGVDCEDP
jgi:hypothetical protein